jgi:hypothetical protein
MLNRADRKTKNLTPQPTPSRLPHFNGCPRDEISICPARHDSTYAPVELSEDCPWPVARGPWRHRAVVRSHFYGVLILVLKPLIWLVHFRVWSASIARQEKTREQLSPLVTKRRRRRRCVVAYNFGAGLELLSVTLFLCFFSSFLFDFLMKRNPRKNSRLAV